MSSHEAPAYFCLTETPRERPPVDSCTEGRLFLTDERLLCGAGDPAVQNGYIGRVDAHAGSTVRRLLGGLKGFQDFTVDEARPREQTQTVGLDTLYSVAVVQWPTTELKGTGQTYGVKLESSEFADRSLIVQLGSGWRNRGSGKNRHTALAALIRAKAQRAGAVITGEKTGTNQPDEAGEIPASDIAAEQTADSRDRDDAGWLTEEADSPALIARNVTAQTVTARIGCRVRGDVQFRDDVRLAGHEQTRWTDLPDAESFEIAVVPDHGDSATLHVEESEAVDGDIQIYLAPQEVSIDTTATEDTPSSDTTNSRTATRTQDSREQQEAVSTPESKTSSSRLRGLIVTSIGLVVWFGSLALAPEVLLPALGTEPRFAPSQAELLGQIEEAVAVFGFLVTIYGVFRIVKPK